MTNYQSNFLKIISDRGFIQDCSDFDTLDKLASDEKLIAYIGFDCTAPTLHAGSLLQIMLLRWFQKTGNKPIVLMGGGTTKVGDPSGKDESRKLLTSEIINKNMEGIKKCFSNYLEFGSKKSDAIMVDNADWLDRLSYIDFLREYGQHFTINKMIKFDSVQLRLEREQPLSFLEFNYMVLQAFDFLELARRYKCNMQMGGSDQWGNIINGIELGRKTDGLNLLGLTSPLLTSSSGAKMGKTASGAIWLDQERTPAYEFWQYWRNTDDQDVCKFLKLFTEVNLDEISKFEKIRGSELNEAKIMLATEVTSLCHGKEIALASEKVARDTFSDSKFSSDLPTTNLPREDLTVGVPAFEILSKTGIVKSKAEARRLIKGGGFRINDKIIENELEAISDAAENQDGFIKLSVGKKRHILIKLI